MDVRKVNKKFLKMFMLLSFGKLANDPAVALKPELSWEVNVLASMKLIELAINKVKNSFLLVLEVSMVLKKKKVTEKLSLEPISVYNKQK